MKSAQNSEVYIIINFLNPYTAINSIYLLLKMRCVTIGIMTKSKIRKVINFILLLLIAVIIVVMMIPRILSPYGYFGKKSSLGNPPIEGQTP